MLVRVILALSLFSVMASKPVFAADKPAPRLVLFVGVDISGSFLKGKHFSDAMDFLAHYLYAHLHGNGGMEEPTALFVGTIGGSKPDEPKTLFPIQTFQNSSIPEIRAKLADIFPKHKSNPFTDFNAFFESVGDTIKDRKLLMKPVSIVLISDGKPDVAGKTGKDAVRTIQLKPLENLSRHVTLRLLYTDAETGKFWRSVIPRKKVKIWTQDATVMSEWKSSNLFKEGKAFPEQDRLFSWVKDNVDFAVRSQRVD